MLIDLERRGLLDVSLVIGGGEFGLGKAGQGGGKSPEAVRDRHSRCCTMVLAGGGAKPGLTYGATDEFGYKVAENPGLVRDLHATVLHPLGIDFKLNGVEPAMKSTGRAFLKWRGFVTVAALSIMAGVACGEPVELLPNPGFEKINDKVLPSYFGTATSADFLSIREARTGDRALRLVARPHEWGFSIFVTPNPGSYPQDDVLTIKVAKGGLYRASVWARGKGILRLGVQQWPSILGSKLSDTVTLTEDWQRLQLEFRADAPDLLSTNLIFRLEGDGAIADIDDASFTFDRTENPGIEHFGRIPERTLNLRVETRDADAVQVFANEKPVAIEHGIAKLKIEEGLLSLAVSAAPAGANPGIRLTIEGQPETDGRWRASGASAEAWKSPTFDDRTWPLVARDKDGYLWSSEWTSIAPLAPGEVFFRQVLLWNETHYGPNRCLLPQAREWGFSRGGFENLTLALYSPLPFSLSDYEFVLEVPEGFELFGKRGDYYMRYVLNQKPDRLIEESLTRDGARLTRYRMFHPENQVCGDTAPYDIFTHYSVLPLRLSNDFEGDTAEFRFRRQARGNFTELEQRIPVRILPPINGRQPKRFMISAYVGLPLGYATLSPEHLDAFVKQIAAAGWTNVSVSVASPGCPGWGPDWLAYTQRYLTLCRANGIQGILWPWHSFPITGSYVQNIIPTDFIEWVENTPGARARYFLDSQEWDRDAHLASMFCPSYVTGEGKEKFRAFVKDVWAGQIEQMGGTEIIWTDDERFIFMPDGKGSYCFCDRCKAGFKAFAELPPDADLSDENIFKTYNKEWRLFWAELWFGRVHKELKQVANELGKKYMVYTWTGSNDLWRPLRGNCDIAFPGMPGSNVMSARGQKNGDDSMAWYRKEMGVERVQGQSFAQMRGGVQKNAWSMVQVISRDGYVDAKSWKSQLLRLAATLQGGVDLGENPIDYTGGSHYWIGEATRIIATFEDLFYEGTRADALAASDHIAYPNLLVLKRGDERLVLLFNEGDENLLVTLQNLELKPGQRGQIFEQDGQVDPASMQVTVPAHDAVAVHIK